MNAVISHETKGVQRKGEVHLHIMPTITILVLIYTLVMTLTWLRDQPTVSLVTRPYAVASANDEAAVENQVLSIVRGWMTTATNSAESMIDSTSVQAVKSTVTSVIADFRNLIAIGNRTAASAQNGLWLRYLPMDDSGLFLTPAE